MLKLYFRIVCTHNTISVKTSNIFIRSFNLLHLNSDSTKVLDETLDFRRISNLMEEEYTRLSLTSKVTIFFSIHSASAADSTTSHLKGEGPSSIIRSQGAEMVRSSERRKSRLPLVVVPNNEGAAPRIYRTMSVPKRKGNRGANFTFSETPRRRHAQL